MLQQILEQQISNVLRQLETDCRVLHQESRHYEIREQLHRRWCDVQPANAGEIRLHELDRVLPFGRRIIHDSIEAAEHWIRLAMRGCPAFAQPLLLDWGYTKNFLNLRHREVEVR